MLRRLALQTARRQVRPVCPKTTRSFRTVGATTTSTTATTTKSMWLATAGALAMAATGLAVTTTGATVQAKEKTPDLTQIKQEIVDIFDQDNSMGPTMVRLAWHASGTYSKHDGKGGSQGGTIRLSPEINHGGNAGLIKAVQVLEQVKKNHPEISYADLYVLAGVTMIEEMGGPEIPFRLGRTDAKDGKACTPDGRLPRADAGSKTKTVDHVREVFYRIGFTDRDIVALIGAHAIGRCYPDRSGYSGPWTNAEWTFSNEFFRELVENKWTLKKWKGPQQYEDPTGKLMMLPSDMSLLWDPKFRQYVEMYAKDEDLWHKDFAQAFVKLTELGVQFPEETTGSTGWCKWLGSK